MTILTSDRAERIEGDGRAERVVTRQGQVVPCDFVPAGRRCGARDRARGECRPRGRQRDTHRRVSRDKRTGYIRSRGQPRASSAVLFDTRLRIEHWDVAAAQGATAASNMLGSMKPQDEAPYFFSGVFDIWIEYLGHAPNWDKLTVRPVRAGKAHRALYRRRPGQRRATGKQQQRA